MTYFIYDTGTHNKNKINVVYYTSYRIGSLYQEFLDQLLTALSSNPCTCKL